MGSKSAETRKDAVRAERFRRIQRMTGGVMGAKALALLRRRRPDEEAPDKRVRRFADIERGREA